MDVSGMVAVAGWGVVVSRRSIASIQMGTYHVRKAKTEIDLWIRRKV